MGQSDERCPCGSGKLYSECCAPLHRGEPAPSPEALMRSRFSAFCKGLADYLLDTTHPEHYAKRLDAQALLRSYQEGCQSGTYSQLNIVETSEEGQKGMVRFEGTFELDGAESRFGERSLFSIHKGRWHYLSGEVYRP